MSFAMSSNDINNHLVRQFGWTQTFVWDIFDKKYISNIITSQLAKWL